MSQNFNKKQDAIAWAKTTEADMITRKITPGLSTGAIRVASVVDKYIEEATEVQNLKVSRTMHTHTFLDSNLLKRHHHSKNTHLLH
jgi:hypothetical protein